MASDILASMAKNLAETHSDRSDGRTSRLGRLHYRL